MSVIEIPIKFFTSQGISELKKSIKDSKVPIIQYSQEHIDRNLSDGTTKKHPVIIEYLIQEMKFPIVEMMPNEFDDIQTWHPVDNKRVERVKLDILSGDEILPVVLLSDGIVLDGHTRIQAYKELNLPMNVLLMDIDASFFLILYQLTDDKTFLTAYNKFRLKNSKRSS